MLGIFPPEARILYNNKFSTKPDPIIILFIQIILFIIIAILFWMSAIMDKSKHVRTICIRQDISYYGFCLSRRIMLTECSGYGWSDIFRMIIKLWRTMFDASINSAGKFDFLNFFLTSFAHLVAWWSCLWSCSPILGWL